MESTNSFEVLTFKKKVLNEKIVIKLSSSGNALSLSTELRNKKYRQTLSKEELESFYIFFKQFSTFEQMLKAMTKILETTNDIEINDNGINIKFKNIIDEDIIITIPEDLIDINYIYLKLKSLEIENFNLLIKSYASKMFEETIQASKMVKEREKIHSKKNKI